jgi:hypothetical protein
LERAFYIGDVLDYAPATSAEERDTVTLTPVDYISEGRASFHPVKNFMSYSDQEEGDRVSEFTQERMKSFAPFQQGCSQNEALISLAELVDVTWLVSLSFTYWTLYHQSV